MASGSQCHWLPYVLRGGGWDFVPAAGAGAGGSLLESSSTPFSEDTWVSLSEISDDGSVLEVMSVSDFSPSES